jgi:hypothetical protein
MSFKTVFAAKDSFNPEWRSKFLLISILLYLVLAPFLEDHKAGEIILILILYVTMVAATLALKEKASLVLERSSPCVLFYGPSVGESHPSDTGLLIRKKYCAGHVPDTCFGEPLHLPGGYWAGYKRASYVSASLYFLLALSWAALYSMLNIVQPGSFSERGVALKADVHWSTVTYFSLTTLTTLDTATSFR